MVTIKKISRYQLFDLILFSYKGDTKGLEFFHVKRFTLEEAVDCTFKMISDEAKLVDFTYYKICYQQCPIGYFVITEDVLYSFCINIKYRKPKIILAWWNIVESLFKGSFYTGIYANNTRALNFLKRRGLVAISNHNNIIKLLKSL